MKHFLIFVFLSFTMLVACSSSQSLTYRPLNSQNLWDIKIEKGYISDQFEVFINGEKVLEETPNWFTKSMDETKDWNGYKVRLLVSYSSGFLGIGKGFNASLFINNELVSTGKY